MTINYTQTGTDSGIAAQAACSGATVGTTSASKVASVGGAPSTTNVIVGGTSFDSGMSRALIFFEIVPAAGTTWAAGDWTVRLNVVPTLATQVTWSATYICRLNSSNVSQATIGSLTGQTTDLTTSGVKTHTVSGSSQTPGAGDKVYVVLVLTAAGNNKQVQFDPDQDITSPFNPAVLTATPLAATVALSAAAPVVTQLATATPLAAAVAASAVAASASAGYVSPAHAINNYMQGRSAGLHTAHGGPGKYGARRYV